ncbi:uracil-DNA glycosylase [Flavobacteriales bacterium]|nr:uracil-DNA glycosylase [Flavobacteriales bacterium]
MTENPINLAADWSDILEKEFSKKYFKNLYSFLEKEEQKNTVFPSRNKRFEALNLTSFNNLKIVIIGQDPYHGKNQANGIAFSVNDNIDYPPSLKNIIKEISNDLSINIEKIDLKKWAKQGVLLLNTILSVRENKPDSHAKQGWEEFTDKIIEKIVLQKEAVIFIAWGNKAIKKLKPFNLSNHYLLTAPHPSPLSSYRGFFGCRHFSKTNKILKKLNQKTIQWV